MKAQLRAVANCGRIWTVASILSVPQAFHAEEQDPTDLAQLTPGVYVLTMEQPEGIRVPAIKTRE